MTLAKNLKSQLNDPGGASSDTVSATSGPWQATATTAHRDKIGVEVKELVVERSAPGPGDVGTWAGNFADRARGLLEPLALQEVDKSGDAALVRSAPPSPSEGGADYYEVKMHGTQKASVKRYHAEGGKRQDVPFTLTHEGLGRLVDDLTGSQG